ncbi:MAG: ribonuclease Y [candidate division WOR-3 bacterium]
MSTIIWIIVVIGVGAIGVVGGILIRGMMASGKTRQAQEMAAQIIKQAEDKKKELLLEAKEEIVQLKSEVEAENRQRRAEISRQEKKLAQRLENLDRKTESFERRERALAQKEQEMEAALAEVEKIKQEQRQKLEAIGGMTSTEAREQLLKMVENETRDALAQRMRQVEAQMKAEADETARKILAEALQRCASEVATESTVSTVPLPNDEMKGRLIGREGRNIRAFEAATGVDLIVDDTPEAVTISCFDPVRREIARVALERLILHGRIHPGRIEDLVDKVRKDIEKNMKEDAEKVLFELGIQNVHPEIVKLSGRLKYRTSYGQNNLWHAREVAFICGMMAAELHLDVTLCKRMALLHDIGKAVTHEHEGAHTALGVDIAKKYGENVKVQNAIASHHGDVEPNCVESVLVAAADALSGARPGARRETFEAYIKRLENLEKVATSFKGIDKAYAISAGREIRVIVKHENISDAEAAQIARDMAKKIHDELTYPGQIKVTVIRESRYVELAK